MALARIKSNIVNAPIEIFSPSEWMVSDATVMHLATAEALASNWKDGGQLLDAIATQYNFYTKRAFLIRPAELLE